MPNPTLYDNFNQVRQYIDQNQVDLGSYVSKSELEGMSYATTSYVVDYVAEHGGGGSTVIDENIIPKETGTYTLGDASHFYNTTYINKIVVDEWGAGISTNGQWSFNLSINGANRFQVKSDSFIPATDRNRDLGDASHYWRSSYTNNLYSPSLVLSYSYNSIDNASNTQINFKVNQWNRMKLTNTALMPSTNNGIKLGDSGAQWSSTYVRDLYLNGTNIINKINGMFSYDSTTGTLTITTMS